MQLEAGGGYIIGSMSIKVVNSLGELNRLTTSSTVSVIDFHAVSRACQCTCPTQLTARRVAGVVWAMQDDRTRLRQGELD